MDSVGVTAVLVSACRRCLVPRSLERDPAAPSLPLERARRAERVDYQKRARRLWSAALLRRNPATGADDEYRHLLWLAPRGAAIGHAQDRDCSHVFRRDSF